MLSVKQKNLLELERGIEEELPMDKLDVDIVKTVDNQDINLWKAHATRIIEREESSAHKWNSPWLSYVSTQREKVRKPNLPSAATLHTSRSNSSQSLIAQVINQNCVHTMQSACERKA